MQLFSHLCETKNFPFELGDTSSKGIILLLSIIKDQDTYSIEYTHQYKPFQVLTIDKITEKSTLENNRFSSITVLDLIPPKLRKKVLKLPDRSV